MMRYYKHSLHWLFIPFLTPHCSLVGLAVKQAHSRLNTPPRLKPTVIILQHLVVDGRGHADGLSREVGIVVETLSQLHSGWRFTITCQQAEHVVLSSVSDGGDKGTRQVNIKHGQTPDFKIKLSRCSDFRALPCVDDVAEIGRQGSVVGDTGCFGVGVRFREVVGQLPWAGEHLSVVIGTIDNLDLKTGWNIR